MWTEASTLAAIAGCAVLVWSGLEKIRDRAPLAATAAGLGLPAALAAAAAIVVPVAELGTVATVVAGLPWYLSCGLFAGLGATFAAAAGWSMLTGRVVACACFGASQRALGWRQLAALPLWLAAGLATAHLAASTIRERAEILAGGMLLLVIARAVPALRRGVDARADRRAVAGG